MRFEFGASARLQARVEPVRLGLPAPLRLLYASDLHLGYPWTARVPDRLMEVARATRPDLLLLGGDLVDRAAAVPRLRQIVAELTGVAPVLAVPGNHDERVGVEVVRDAVRAAGGRWLPDDPLEFPIPIDGVVKPSVKGPRVLCAHDPVVFPAAAVAGYALVLAGHLHGGQCVLWERGGMQYPAVWFHPWHGSRFGGPGCVMLVSRGAADTFPFRVNCPREVILCELS